MQTKGGGKHDILPVGRATATTLECLWMMPRDPDADMCPGTDTAPVSTEECMAHQSCVPSADHLPDRSNHGAVRRAVSQVGVYQTTEELMASKQWSDRPIRRAR
jgi:hypothetical protein